MSRRMLSLVLLTSALFLSACGGGGGGNQDDEDNVVDPLTRIEGIWKGTDLLGGQVVDMTVDSSGGLTEILVAGVSEVLDGTFSHLTGGLYAGTFTLDNGESREWRLLLEATDTYAVFVEADGGALISLQRNAATILPRTMADYIPRGFVGVAARFDAVGSLLDLGGCGMATGGGAEFAGRFGSLTFASVPGNPLEFRFPNGTAINGACDDDDATTNVNQLYIVSHPDGNAVAFGAFDVGVGRHVYFGVLQREP